MSNYYEYEDVKIAMYHALQKKEGWKLYGYKADESDLMTDYYSPAHWGGIGVKNGYILCVNVYGEEKERTTGTETKKMVENGGYYSIFVHGFIFKKFPSFLNTAAKEEKQEQKEEFAKIEKPSFESFKPFEVPEEPKEPKEQTDKQNKPDFETFYYRHIKLCL